MTHGEDLSRRALLRTALLATAASTAAVVTGCEGNDTGLVRSVTGEGGAPAGDGAASKTETGVATKNANDVSVLNALLATEYGAIDAYAAGASILGAPSADDPLAALAPVLLAIATHFHDQHVAHAEALQGAVRALSATPLATSKVSFVAPAGFAPSVTNVLKLACNAERAAAISYVGAVGQLSSATNRFLAASIEGDETQHFMVLYAVLTGTVDPGPSLSALSANEMVPAPFVAAVGLAQSLDDIPDFDVTT
jgi:hypothetical protein